MAPVHSRVASHERDADRSSKLLRNARENATKLHKYNSLATRLKIYDEFRARNDNKEPYEWQMDVAEALVLGLDCTVIAGTGAGKTMPFVMPLFVHPEKHIIVISPLNALEQDQAARFRKMNLTAVAVNGETYNKNLHNELEKRKHQVIVTSPEMCLKHDQFRQLLSSPAFAQRIAAIIIDEGHCISQWGEKFREDYMLLGTLRAFVPAHVPFLVTSATLPPPVLAQVRSVVHIQPSTSYHVNLGTDRPNIAWEVRHMKAGKSDLSSLSFLLPQSRGGEGTENGFKQTLVFGDDINVLMSACRWLRENSPAELRDKIAVYHSRRTARAKKIVLEGFRNATINILFTTEAAGMGCDMPHIEQVVQFMVPASLSIWMQRAGRAGRSIEIRARAILLVQPTVFQEKNPKLAVTKDPDKENQTVYVKAVEEGLRAWIETTGCRRDVSDEYFDSGAERKRT
ncbi:P-loop containing nucleoside triphosphate hydrolase protein [Leucogyrophana mollusca]|uniref:P-loop containing nucleoside triphosphate hydrolase protein n=1 Tax=Leucogyrophana mollusca TaxID=85980 RepID=A0ACB8AWG2_9AGAM|nr:P-loop containing nucleoside triphosphate hydrolase protein [Leucogyrophana mollusca]